MILLLVDTLHQPTLQKYGDIHVCYMLNDFNLTSTESDFLRSPFDKVIEVAPPQGKLFFYQSQLSLPVRNQQICSRSATDLFYEKQTSYRSFYRLQSLFSVCSRRIAFIVCKDVFLQTRNR